ncbi:uncharacterized protein EDB91DRAFT_1253605 [Suillus paluster]|uniref:uncharacterized protein n=1 Tax=Suillus paluster TaxID=48578 RepID=UPI001B8654E4|nr:uncharacterized protein EDB91DRAFT_1253605 [Suillus paluster]KAG1728183.1 hypothetical protein EDB91DRAFT_1253605 [Suillus paluster]
MSRSQSAKISGLSKSTITHNFRRSHRTSQVLSAGGQKNRMNTADAKRQSALQELPAIDRENVENMIIDHGIMTDNLVYEPAPGDEGLDLSHEGGEYEAFEGLSRTMADLSGL